MPRRPIDKDLVRRRFERGATTYDRHAVVQRGMADSLAGCLADMAPPPNGDRVLEVGCGSGVFTARLLDRLRIRHLIANDLSGAFRASVLRLAAHHSGTRIDFLEGDIETMDLPTALDVVAANAVFQWLSCVESLVARILCRMKPGGILAFTTFGVDNFRELAFVSGHTLAYRSFKAYNDMLQPQVEVVSAWEEKRVLQLKTPLDVIRHIRATGTNAIDSRSWKRSDLDAFSARYIDRYGMEGVVPLTYHPMFFVCRKRTQ